VHVRSSGWPLHPAIMAGRAIVSCGRRGQCVERVQARRSHCRIHGYLVLDSCIEKEHLVAFHVRDPETDRLVRRLAQKHRIGLTEAIRLAVSHELQREEEAIPLAERIAALRTRVMRRPATGLKADKAFFDELSGDL